MEIRAFEPHHAELKVGVIMGGTSSEREVSLSSGKQIAEALRTSGFQVIPIDLQKDEVPAEAHDCDVVFLALHGGYGENGGIQADLDAAGIVYVGSGANSSQLCMDKDRSKAALETAGLPVPMGMLVSDPGMTLEFNMAPPFVVKPNHGGSSVALTIARTRDEWFDALDRAFEEEQEILVEEFIEGTELTVGLLDGKALMPVEIVPPNGVYDYDAKYVYNQGKTEYFCPPRALDEATISKLQEIAERAWHVLEARDLVRVDFILDKSDKLPKILEANTLPGFTPTSLMPKAAAHAGISYEQLCTHLVLSALQRKTN